MYVLTCKYGVFILLQYLYTKMVHNIHSFKFTLILFILHCFSVTKNSFMHISSVNMFHAVFVRFGINIGVSSVNRVFINVHVFQWGPVRVPSYWKKPP